MGNCVKKMTVHLLSAAVAVTMISGPVPVYAAEAQDALTPQDNTEVVLLEENIEDALIILGEAYCLEGNSADGVLVSAETLKDMSELSGLEAFEEGQDQGPGETLPAADEEESEKQTETAGETEAATEVTTGADDQTEAVTETEAATEATTGADSQTEAVTETEAATEVTTGADSQTEAVTETEAATEVTTGAAGESEANTESEAKADTGNEPETKAGTDAPEESGTESETTAADEAQTGSGTAEEGETQTESGTTEESGSETESGTTKESETETESGTAEESEPETGAEETESESETESEPETAGESESETESGTGEEETPDFQFENGNVEVTVTVKEGVQLPENTKLVVEKLSEDSEEYAEAKKATDALSGTEPATGYDFYSVELVQPDGKELELEPGMLTVQVMLKSVGADGETGRDIVRIRDNVAEKVGTTAQEGGLGSVDFEI